MATKLNNQWFRLIHSARENHSHAVTGMPPPTNQNYPPLRSEVSNQFRRLLSIAKLITSSLII